jgi:aminomethyltransferase
MDILKRTALYDEHVKAGGRLVPFAGWEMPVQYAGVIPEVRAVREGCGLFDVSHMGQLDLTGEGGTEAINAIVSADWSGVQIGRVAYALLLNEDGGVIDDVMGYHLAPNEWLIVVNASRADIDEPHIARHLGDGLRQSNRYGNQAMLAIQGTHAADVLQTLTDYDLSQMKWRDCTLATVGGARGVLARGGYTGCDGFEFMFFAEDAARVWNALLQAGAVPCGLGARDVLRLEAGLPLYGHELREEWTPYESGVSFVAKVDKPQFLGREALLQKQTPSRRVRALKMQGKAIPREGYAVYQGGVSIGEVTSGTLSPTLGAGIALAMLPTTLEVGDVVEIQIRSGLHAAEVVKLPFVSHGRK